MTTTSCLSLVTSPPSVSGLLSAMFFWIIKSTAFHLAKRRGKHE